MRYSASNISNISSHLSNKPRLKNTQYQNSPPRTLKSPSILSNLIGNGFGPVEVLYEIFK